MLSIWITVDFFGHLFGKCVCVLRPINGDIFNQISVASGNFILKSKYSFHRSIIIKLGWVKKNLVWFYTVMKNDDDHFNSILDIISYNWPNFFPHIYELTRNGSVYWIFSLHKPRAILLHQHNHTSALRLINVIPLWTIYVYIWNNSVKQLRPNGSIYFQSSKKDLVVISKLS